MLKLLKSAKKAVIPAKYVLFDSWFSSPSSLHAIKEIGYDVIAMVKKTRMRDGHMAEKVEWFLEHGDGSLIFINGHNGHIGRMDATLYYNCLGKLLYEELGDGYFAIGTDAEVTIFNSQTDDGFEEKKVQNSNDLNALAAGNNGNYYYVDFSTAEEDNDWNEILSKKQSITSLNVGGPTIIKAFYTTEIIPIDTFDGMIIYDKVSPTTLEL